MLNPICPSCTAQPCQCRKYSAARDARRLLVIDPRPELRDQPGAVWRYKLAIGVGLDPHVETIRLILDGFGYGYGDGYGDGLPQRGRR